MSSIESGGGAGAPKTARLSAGETWRALYRHFRPHRRIVALGAFLALIGAGGGTAQPPPTKKPVQKPREERSVTHHPFVLP
ncbi:ABC transporter ATP-binding protein, partial [Streptomyces sp. NPDC060131]